MIEKDYRLAECPDLEKLWRSLKAQESLKLRFKEADVPQALEVELDVQIQTLHYDGQQDHMWVVNGFMQAEPGSKKQYHFSGNFCNRPDSVSAESSLFTITSRE